KMQRIKIRRLEVECRRERECLLVELYVFFFLKKKPEYEMSEMVSGARRCIKETALRGVSPTAGNAIIPF
ncbi:hypothetical protein, partial [Pseudomonas tremae]|uniref:hypothetical protein n=1 Tax=Pseudomonas tremae TaxID=200454 RepID=UPI001F2B4B0B